jgi:hypothetical protein
VVILIEPLVLPNLAGVDELVVEVDLAGPLPHLDASTTDHSKKI